MAFPLSQKTEDGGSLVQVGKRAGGGVTEPAPFGNSMRVDEFTGACEVGGDTKTGGGAGGLQEAVE